MNNVFIKGQIPDLNLDRKLNLHNGSLIIVPGGQATEKLNPRH